MSKSCRECCREFRGWCKSFTPVETVLVLVEFILLVALVAFLVFLILHLLFCTGGSVPAPFAPSTAAPTTTRCTATGLETAASPPATPPVTPATRCTAAGLEATTTGAPDVLAPELTDGEEVDDRYSFVLALAKLQPTGTTFGCILTVITPYWTLTAASCIEAIEEVDSLDAFAIVEGFGGLAARAHGVSDVAVHPGRADAALLRAARRLRAPPAPLVPPLALHRFAIGERLLLLGFGPFRSAAAGARRLRGAGVALLARAQCSGAAPRHLRPLAARAPRPPAVAPLCAGVLYQRGVPCQYCAGAPLVRDGAVLGVAAGDGACGAACEPARFAAPAHLRRWLRAVAGRT